MCEPYYEAALFGVQGLVWLCTNCLSLSIHVYLTILMLRFIMFISWLQGFHRILLPVMACVFGSDVQLEMRL